MGNLLGSSDCIMSTAIMPLLFARTFPHCFNGDTLTASLPSRDAA
jgi:hypothetical protein